MTNEPTYHQLILARYYMGWYVWCHQRAIENPRQAAHFLNRQALYLKLYLQATPTLTINDLLP